MKTKISPLNQLKKVQTKINDSSFLRYSSLAFEMMAIIGLGVFGGYFLDKEFKHQFPWLTLIFSISSVILAIYIAIKDFIHPNRKD